MLVCGPNGMGFYNPRDGVWVCGFDTRNNHRPGGNVTLISHSGAGMSGIVDCEERIDFNLAVSTGSEFTVGVADYMDFVIEEHQPRAIGLFLETARDPQALRKVLAKAFTTRHPGGGREGGPHGPVRAPGPVPLRRRGRRGRRLPGNF